MIFKNFREERVSNYTDTTNTKKKKRLNQSL